MTKGQTLTNDRITRIPAPVIPGISDSTRVSAGDLVFISGAVGFEQDGSVPGDFARAIELTFGELKRALEVHGLGYNDLVRINVYIAKSQHETFQQRLMTFRTTRDTIIDTTSPSASSVIGVDALFNDATIEIDAIAAIPAS